MPPQLDRGKPMHLINAFLPLADHAAITDEVRHSLHAFDHQPPLLLRSNLQYPFLALVHHHPFLAAIAQLLEPCLCRKLNTAS
jgi:hypothetical protein